MKRSLKNKSGKVGIRKGISENNTDKLCQIALTVQDRKTVTINNTKKYREESRKYLSTII